MMRDKVVTKTVTVNVASATGVLLAPRDSCPICFNCNTQGCGNFGICKSSTCTCPTGFGGLDCLTPLCGSSLSPNANRPLRSDGGVCQCDTGFIGSNCNVCTSDSACAAMNSNGETAVCNKDLKVWQAGSSFCEINAPILQAAFPLTSTISLFRNATDQTTLGSLWYNGDEQFVCKINQCTQQLVDSQYQWYCTDAKCACTGSSMFCGGKGSSIDLTQPINAASGDFLLTCPQNISSCNAKFSFLADLFPSGLDLSNCHFGECALLSKNQTLPTVITARGLNGPETVGVVVAGIAIGIAIGGFIWSWIYQCQARKRPPPPTRKGATIEFQNISYILPKGQILQGISGVVNAGSVFAIMGPSGAGKSTFLDILAGKSKRGLVDGEIKVDGQAVSLQTLHQLVGFVDQEDLLMPTMTVRETLAFSAALRLPESVSKAHRDARVNEILEALGLSHVANSYVGGFGRRGISGGEKRRVSIGVELVTNPAVLLLDEPTSGLDSFNALSVIRTLADLAHVYGKTVVFTIHQPRSDVYALFDTVMLISAGTAMFCGPGNGAAGFCKSLGKPCPEGYNIADHLLDLAVGENRSLEQLSRSKHSLWSLTFRRRKRVWGETGARKTEVEAYSHTHNTVGKKQEEVEETTSPDGNPKEHHVNVLVQSEKLSKWAEPHKVYDPQPVGFLTQLMALLTRSFKHLYRTPSLLVGHIAMSILLGVLIGSVYYNAGTTLAGIQNRFGSLLFLLALIGFSGLSGIGSFANERNLFLRERGNRFYTALPYYISKLVFDLIPLRVLPTLIMGTICFYMVGYTSGGGHFGKYLGILLVFSAEIGLLGMLFAIVFSDIGSATLYGAIVILFKMLFSGLLINQSNIIPALSWMQFLSFFRFAYEALVVNDLTDIQIVDTISGATVNIPASTVLIKFGFDIQAYWRDLLISIAILFFLLLSNGALIHFMLKERR